MKIGVLLNPYDEDAPAGLGRLIFEWINGFLEIDRKSEYIVFVKKTPRGKPNLPGTNWKMVVLGERRGWLEHLKETPVDVNVFFTPVMPLFHTPKRSVVFALDFAYWHLPPPTLRGHVTKYATFLFHLISFCRAQKIVAVSEHTKKDVMRIFKIPERKIEVVYCGFKPICSLPESPVRLPEKFFFSVGVIKPRKNTLNTVKAFYEFSKNHDDFSLVIAGKGGGAYLDSIYSFIKEKRIEEKVVFLGFVSDEELSYIYKKAFCLVFPSLVEGLGFPVHESMDCGTPVITSNVSALPEAGGDAALFADPYDPKEIARAMSRIVDEKGLRDTLIKKGYAHVKNFSWEKAAREVRELLKI